MIGSWVVDASVAIKPYLPEDLSDVAANLFQRARTGKNFLFVPDIFFPECANIFWKHVRRLTIKPDQAREGLHGLTTLPLSLVPGKELIQRTFDLALNHGLSAYDASYVALAEDLNLPLITADRKLIGKLDGSGVEVRWLGDLPA